MHYPTRWDYIPRIVFGRLIRQGGFRPSRRHNGRTLLDVGYTEYAQYVHLSDGLKSPVYSIYERMAGEEEPIGPPTLVAEVGYSQDVAGLENNAARYISKSNGNIRVVITLELGFGVSQGVMCLQKATWSHWEADEEEQHEPNVLEMSFQGISLGDYRRIPESTTMARHAPMPACLARRTAAYQVCFSSSDWSD